GHSVSRTQNISEATAQKIDSEIHRIIDECYVRAKEILTTRQADLNVLARGLLEYETLTGDEILGLLKGIPPVRTPYEDPVLPSRGEGTSVPAAGKPRSQQGPGPIITPEPQPGH
ncbi:MAG: cell division protein FtsH, partial [Rhizomicrobium sp.]